MNNLLFNHKFILLLLSLVWISCAQQLTPGGGPIDNKAPALLNANPPLNGTNFNSKEIELKFNEFVTLKDLNKYLLISPPTKNTPEVVVSGKRVKIKIKDTLLANTTYQLYLGNAIADIHESNPLENFSYIFSTGNVIDSLKIRGKVVNASDRSNAEGVNVQVYSAQTDSIALKGMPKHISKTNKQGEYIIEAMAPGSYYVVALNDKNSNYTFENASDKIGFLNSAIELVPDTSRTHLLVDEINLFEETPDKQFIKKTNNTSYGRIEFLFNRTMNNPQVVFDYPKFSETWKYQYFSKYNDTLTIWYDQTFNDSLAIRIKADDYADTVRVNLMKKQTQSGKGDRKAGDSKLNLELMGINNGELLPDKNIVLKSFSPIKSVLNQKVMVKNKKDSLWCEIKKINDTRFEILGITTIDDNQYQLLILPNTFTNVLGISNDSIRISFKTPELSSFGSMKLVKEASLENKNLIVEIINEKGTKVAGSIFTDKITEFNLLLPDVYSIKVVVDEDRNGIWTTGNYKNKTQPEKVFYMKEQSVKKRFETEIIVKE